MTVPVRTVSTLIARLVVGGVLALASLAKVFSFRQFAAGLPQLAYVPGELSAILAACIIVIELGTGLLLLSGKSLRIAGSAAGFLFVSFVLVLSSAVFRGVDLPCNCFGFLGLNLTLRGQALLDIVLAGAASFVVWNSGESKRTRGKSAVIAAAFITALSWSAALIAWPDTNERGTGDGAIPISYLRGIGEGTRDRPSVLLLADFDDFGCRLCLDDFLAFCDSLNGARFLSAVSIRLVARRDTSRTTPDQARIVNGWAAGNGYRFSVSVDADSLFEHSGVGKTSAIILAADGKLIDIAHFPTGRLKRTEILRAIAG